MQSLTADLIKGHAIPFSISGQFHSPGRACVQSPANATLILESEKPRGCEYGAGTHWGPVADLGQGPGSRWSVQPDPDRW